MANNKNILRSELLEDNIQRNEDELTVGGGILVKMDKDIHGISYYLNLAISGDKLTSREYKYLIDLLIKSAVEKGMLEDLLNEPEIEFN